MLHPNMQSLGYYGGEGGDIIILRGDGAGFKEEGGGDDRRHSRQGLNTMPYNAMPIQYQAENQIGAPRNQIDNYNEVDCIRTTRYAHRGTPRHRGTTHRRVSPSPAAVLAAN